MKEGCRKYFTVISEYLDGELDEAVCSQIEDHLRKCPECRQCVDSLDKTIQLCRQVAREEMPEHMKEQLRSRLKAFMMDREPAE